MRDGWIILRTFTSDLEAQAARGLLEARGLQALIEVDNCGGMRPHLDYTALAKLLVPEQEAAQAQELMQAAADSPPTASWNCTGCGENVEAGFDTCWKCGQARD